MNIDCVCSQAPGKHGKARDTTALGLSVTGEVLGTTELSSCGNISACCLSLQRYPPLPAPIYWVPSIKVRSTGNVLTNTKTLYCSEGCSDLSDCDPGGGGSSHPPAQTSCWFPVSPLLSPTERLHPGQQELHSRPSLLSVPRGSEREEDVGGSLHLLHLRLGRGGH